MPRGSSCNESYSGSRRELYSHSDYLGFIHYGGLPLSHDEYESKSTDEDPRMLAFFDSLIQREKNNLHSDSDDSFLDDFHLSFILQPDSSEESDSDHPGTSMSRLLMRELLSRPSPGSPDREAATNSSGQGVLRRLRHLRDAAVIRDLLNADSSSSDDDDEDVKNRIKVVLPELPRDLENGQSTAHSPVRFKRHQSRTKRQYRFQNKSRNDNVRSGVSCGHAAGDSSSSDSDSKYKQQKSKTKTGRDISYLEGNRGSSSTDTDDDYRTTTTTTTTKKTESSSDEADSRKFRHKNKKRKGQGTNAQSAFNNLETSETVCRTSEHKTDEFTDTRDNHNANNNSGVKNAKSNKTTVSTEAHANNHQEAGDGSEWTDQSDHVPAVNKKSAKTQRKEEEKGPGANRKSYFE